MRTYGNPVKYVHGDNQTVYGILDSKHLNYYDEGGSIAFNFHDFKIFKDSYKIENCEINDVHLRILDSIKYSS